MTRTAFSNGDTGLAVRTELNRHLGEVINVKSYGATGDGTTNDSANVSAAINAAFSLGVPRVVFPPGTYAVKNVRLKSGIHYELMKGATILTYPDAALGTNLLNANGESGIVISGGGIIDGNKGVVAGSPSSGVALLQLVGSENITVSGITFQNNEYLAVIPSEASNIRVERCEFYNTDCAFQPAQDCHDIWAIDNLIDGGTSDGIAIWATSSSANSTNVHIRGNTIKNKASGNAIILRRCDHFDVSGNIIEDCALGVNFNTGESSGGTCSFGSVANNDFTGIGSTFAIGGKAAFYASILGNTISQCDENGIYFESLSYSSVRGNIIKDVNEVLNDSDGIRLQSADYVLVDGNSVIDDRGVTKNYTGIRIISGNRNTLSNNKVRNVTLVDAYITTGVTATYANNNDCRIDDFATAGQTVMVDNNRGADGTIVVASGATSLLLRDAPRDLFLVSAAATRTISTINGGWIGRTVTLAFSDGNIVLNNGGNIRLAGGTLTSVADGNIELQFNGTNWLEKGRALSNI